MDPYKLASEGLVSYAGDSNPLDYDGAWIDPGTWEGDGYASCVRVSVMPDCPDGGKHIVVERLTINKPKDMGPALQCCGLAGMGLSPIAEAVACLYYGHYDPDHSDWRESQHKSFIVPDDGDGIEDFRKYADIHGAIIADEATVWGLLEDWVGRKLKVN